jgi:hypothetical protein
MALYIAIIFGLIGTGFLIYGKKQSHLTSLIVGVLLSVLPYFVHHPYVLLISGVLLIIFPFLNRS